MDGDPRGCEILASRVTKYGFGLKQMSLQIQCGRIRFDWACSSLMAPNKMQGTQACTMASDQRICKRISVTTIPHCTETPQLHGVGWLVGSADLRVGMERGCWWQITWSRVWWSFPASASSNSIAWSDPQNSNLFYFENYFSLISMRLYIQNVNFTGLKCNSQTYG